MSKPFNFLMSNVLFVSTALAGNMDIQPDKEEPGPPEISNFALPTAQQPSRLIGFGGNIIDKGQTQLSLMPAYLSGSGQYQTLITPSYLYAFTDDFSIYIEVPDAMQYKNGPFYASGLADSSVQLEYAFYNYQNRRFVDQATVVSALTLPTGSTVKYPPTGVGAVGVFLGGTFTRVYLDWFLFTSQGVQINSEHNQTKYGNDFLYQFGFGKNMCSRTHQSILAWEVEITGQYSTKDNIQNVTNPNSGGNTIFVTPSLFWSNKTIILQFGAGFPVVQNLNGTQNNNHTLLAANFTYTFY